jgi:hypothetical protein
MAGVNIGWATAWLLSWLTGGGVPAVLGCLGSLAFALLFLCHCGARERNETVKREELIREARHHRDIFGRQVSYREAELMADFAEIVAAKAVAKERERCAKIAETAPDLLQNSTFEGVASAIRQQHKEDGQ